jgi:transposase
MESMASPKQNRYPQEMRDRAVRLVLEWRQARGRPDGGLTEVGKQLGIHPESIRNWLRLQEIEGGVRDGFTADERQRMRELERENRELRRANEILKSAAAFFGAELDRQPKR